MTVLAPLISGPLYIAAALHILWAFGSTWPCKSEEQLIRTVMGAPQSGEHSKGQKSHLLKMFVTLCVAIMIAIAATLPLIQIGWVNLAIKPWIVSLLLSAQGAIFLLRGFAGYTPKWQKLTPLEPFRTLDKRFYSPLCIVLGAASLILALS